MTVTTDVRPDDEAAAANEPTTEVAEQAAKKPGTELAEFEGKSALSLRPGQTLDTLSPEQSAALSAAFNFDPFKDKTSWPHIQAFIHFCLTRGYDPINGEAYLIKRGDKFTRQTGIDGFRRKAHEAHLNGPWRYRGLVGIYWTSDEDTPDWWIVDPKRKIRERVWTDAWIWKDKNPAAARAVIEYENERGEIRETEMVAHWGMFAPMVPEYEDAPNGGRRKKLDPVTRKPVMVLAEMWRKGPEYMLGKCALAAVLRDTFPATFGGLYINEELHRADVEAAEERRQAAAQERLRLMREAQAERAQQDGDAHTDGAVHTDPVHTPDMHARTRAHVVPGAVMREGPPVQDGPVHVSETVADVIAHLQPPPADADEDTRRGWLLDEMAHMAEVMGVPVRNIVARRLQQNPDEVSPEHLIDVVGPMRAAVITKMREGGRGAEADVYAQAGTKLIAPYEALLGILPDDAYDGGGDVHTEAPEPVHTEPADVHDEAPAAVHADGGDAQPEAVPENEPHQFYPDSGTGKCMDCGEPENHDVHTPPPGVEE